MSDIDMHELEQRLGAVEGMVEDLVHRLQQAENRQEEILEGVDAIRQNIQEMLDIWRSTKGFMRVLGWIGFGVKWLAVTGGAIALVWAAITKGFKA